ncbi:MAG: sugar phosphate isomerase/epimerase [Chryseolinea sp.]
MNRRQFVATGASSLILASPLFQQSTTQNSSMHLGKTGIQLYTLRDLIAKDIHKTLNRLSTIGFAGVETAFWPDDVSIEDAGKILKEKGLTVLSSHCEIPVGDGKEKMLRMAEAYHCKRMVWHGWPEDKRYKTSDGIKELTSIYNEASAFAKSNGLQFGLHNHWWEFHNRIGDRFAYEVLQDDLDKDVFFEIDTYWVKTAGHDPAKIVKQLGKRAPLLHIKDGPARYNDDLANDKSPMVPVGKGTQDFPSIVKAAAGNTEWMIVEMDLLAMDHFEAIQQSYDFLTKNKLAVGEQ